MLEEAGIPWKEYPVTHAQFSEVLEIPSSPNAILPSSQSMASIKDGPNTDVTFLGEDGLLSVLNADTGMRVPKISAFWPKEETLPAEQTATAETVVSAEGPGQTSETFSSETAETSLSISSEPRTVEDVITEACAECDILFLPSGVILSDDVETIARLATEAGVPTVSADPSDGETPVLGDGEELPVQSEDNSTPELPDLDSESGEAGETGSTGETGPESGSEPAPDGGDDLTVNEDGSITLPPIPLP